jgi:hypothetical protein
MLWTLVGIVLLVVFGPLAVRILAGWLSDIWYAFEAPILIGVAGLTVAGVLWLVTIVLPEKVAAFSLFTIGWSVWAWVLWKAIQSAREAKRKKRAGPPESADNSVA